MPTTDENQTINTSTPENKTRFDLVLRIYLIWLFASNAGLLIWTLQDGGSYGLVALFLTCPILNSITFIMGLLYYFVAKIFKLELTKNFIWKIFIPPFIISVVCALAISG